MFRHFTSRYFASEVPNDSTLLKYAISASEMPLCLQAPPTYYYICAFLKPTNVSLYFGSLRISQVEDSSHKLIRFVFVASFVHKSLAFFSINLGNEPRLDSSSWHKPCKCICIIRFHEESNLLSFLTCAK